MHALRGSESGRSLRRPQMELAGQGIHPRPIQFLIRRQRANGLNWRRLIRSLTISIADQNPFDLSHQRRLAGRSRFVNPLSAPKHLYRSSFATEAHPVFCFRPGSKVLNPTATSRTSCGRLFARSRNAGINFAREEQVLDIGMTGCLRLLPRYGSWIGCITDPKPLDQLRNRQC